MNLREFITIVENAQGTHIHGSGNMFIATVNGEYAGKLNLSTKEGDPSQRYVDWSEVLPQFRRQGVATALYDAAEAYLEQRGEVLAPSPNQSISAKAFWDARRKKNHFPEITETAQQKRLDPTPENIELAREFVFGKWKERAIERGQPEPSDLSYACKFSSMFAQRIFGGEVQGNLDHQYLRTWDGNIVDLNIDAEDVKMLGDDAHWHDEGWFGCPEHNESIASCRPRVEKWVREFWKTR